MAKGKILIIEDDAILAKMYQKKFKLKGFEASVVYTGAEGIIAASAQKPDVILLDVLLPAMDGLSVLRVLKGDVKTKNIPVIVLTNLGGNENLAYDAKRLGAQDYLIKYKTSSQKIVERVEKIIGEDRHGR